MLRLVRKLLYKAASAFERRSDENYYFVGCEMKIDRRHAFDFPLRILARKSPDAVRRFYRLADSAAGMEDPDFGVFKVFAAASGEGLFDGVSDEGSEYLLLKAYRRGMSLRAARADKAEVKRRIMNGVAMRILLNSMYGALADDGRRP